MQAAIVIALWIGFYLTVACYFRKWGPLRDLLEGFGFLAKIATEYGLRVATGFIDVWYSFATVADKSSDDEGNCYLIGSIIGCLTVVCSVFAILTITLVSIYWSL